MQTVIVCVDLDDMENHEFQGAAFLIRGDLLCIIHPESGEEFAVFKHWAWVHRMAAD